MRVSLVLLFAAMVIPTQATSAAPASAAETAAPVGRKVAAEVRRLLNEHYVAPELRAKFVTVLTTGMESGRYDVAKPEELVQRLNEDLQTVTPDKHLGVMYDPATSRELAAAGDRAGADDAPATAEDIANADRRNHGLIQLKMLPGNIRYLEMDGFVWVGQKTEQAYDTAMSFLAGGDAVIIDMRKNRGGDPAAVRYLVSHFIEPNTPLMTFFMGSNGVNRSISLAKLTAPRMTGKPLYVLTSGGSASAAEEFLGHVSGYKLGELIGEKSAGAGFRNEFFTLPDGLLISISVGRAVLASTGKDWEGVGIAPTIEVPQDKALDMALTRALRKVAETAPPNRKKSLLAVATLQEAQVNPVKTALPFGAYAGVYGERTVRTDGQSVTIQRIGGPVSVLVAIAPNRFAYVNDPETTVSFDLSGERVTALHLVRSDGSTADGTRTD
jgi:hypothetical protein